MAFDVWTVAIRVEQIGRPSRGIEAGDEIARLAADAVCSVKFPARQNLAVRLDRDGYDGIARVRVERIG